MFGIFGQRNTRGQKGWKSAKHAKAKADSAREKAIAAEALKGRVSSSRPARRRRAQ